MSIVKEAIPHTDLQPGGQFIDILRAIHPGLVVQETSYVSSEAITTSTDGYTLDNTFDTIPGLSSEISNIDPVTLIPSGHSFADQHYQVPNPTDENVRNRFFHILATTRFVIYPHRTDSDPIYRPQIVGSEKQEDVLNAIARGHIGDAHIEAIVSMTPSNISLYNTRDYVQPSPDSAHPQIVESAEVARNIKMQSNKEDIFFLLKGIVSEMSLDSNRIRENSPFDIDKITENKRLEAISDATFGAIIRTFVILDCENAYKFYKLTDAIMEKYSIAPDSEDGKKVKDAAFAFAKIVYGEQNQWAIIGRQLMGEGEEILKAELTRNTSQVQFIRPISQEVTEGFSTGDLAAEIVEQPQKTLSDEEQKRVSIFHTVKQKTSQFLNKFSPFYRNNRHPSY